MMAAAVAVGFNEPKKIDKAFKDKPQQGSPFADDLQIEPMSEPQEFETEKWWL